MRHNWPLAVVIATVTVPPDARAQSPAVAEIEFPSDGFAVRGRFFSAGRDAFAT